MAIITSTIGTSGRTYSTLQSWEDAVPANAVTAGNSYVGECYNDSEFTGTAPLLTIAGTTTDSTHTITLKCASGQSFYNHASKLTNQLKYDASKGVGIKSSGGFFDHTVVINSQWVTLDGLQIYGTSTANGAVIHNLADNTIVKNCIVYTIDTSTYGVINSTGASATFVNNLIIHAGATTTSSTAISIPGGGSIIACTAVRIGSGGSATGYGRGYSTPLIRDCAAFGFDKFGRDTTGTGGYNCTDLASGDTPGSNNIYSKIFASQFTDITNTSAMDFRVKAGADLINAGTRDATNTADLDIVNSARSTTTPTIGAWEYSSGGVASYSYTAVGGMTVSGAATKLRGAVKAPSGGLTISGTSPQLRGVDRRSSGGLTFSGDARPIRSRLKSAAGGLTFAGAASLTFFAAVQSLVVTAVGGINFSGAATKVRSIVRTVTGGVIFAGNATIQLTPDPTPTSTRHFKRGRRPRTRP